MSGPRIGLVLGAGGILGAAWLTGVLEGFRRATGFEVPDAALTVGTSAGAFIGAILATGVPTQALYGQCTGADFEQGAHPHLRDLVQQLDGQYDGSWLQRFPMHRRVQRPVLACPRLAWRGVREPRLRTPELLFAGLAGDGLFSGRGIGTVVRNVSQSLQHRVTSHGWPQRPLWIVSCDLELGERVVFGRDGPIVPLEVAVRASTAIPGLFAPERIEGRRHVDGGTWSATNLDVLAAQDLDLVIVLSPLSGGQMRPLGTGPWSQKVGLQLVRLFRKHVDSRLAVERQLVTANGTPVLVLHPDADEIAAMPFHCMSAAQRGAVMQRAAERTERVLTAHADWQRVRALLEAAIWPREAWLRAA